jgi:uncharacterized coiled-coil protein SlyX
VDTFGNGNTATGFSALSSNTTGADNTAVGSSALASNTTGNRHTAVGSFALQNCDVSSIPAGNTAVGTGALFSDTSGNANTAVGDSALSSVLGAQNTAVGGGALSSATGNQNTAIGYNAGFRILDATNVICIGALAGYNVSNSCFIGNIWGVPVEAGAQVIVNSFGQLGVVPSGSPLSMNELLKQRRIVQQLKTTTEKQAARIALQESQIQTLTAALKQQAELESTVAHQQKQIEALTAGLQKVSAQLEASRSAPQVADTNY